MSETKMTGQPRWSSTPKAKTAADYVYPMPTVEEVVGRGYPAAYWHKVKADRDALIARFDADPVFRAEVIAQHEQHERDLREAGHA